MCCLLRGSLQDKPPENNPAPRIYADVTDRISIPAPSASKRTTRICFIDPSAGSKLPRNARYRRPADIQLLCNFLPADPIATASALAAYEHIDLQFSALELIYIVCKGVGLMRQLLRHDDLVDIAPLTPVLIIPGDNLNKALRTSSCDALCTVRSESPISCAMRGTDQKELFDFLLALSCRKLKSFKALTESIDKLRSEDI